MKRKLLVILVNMLIILSNCANTSMNTVIFNTKPDYIDHAVNSLYLDPEYVYSTERLRVAEVGTVTAACLHEGKLWFIADGAAYCANSDGSEAVKLFDSIPEDGDKYITIDAAGATVYVGFIRMYCWNGANLNPVENQNQYIAGLLAMGTGSPAALVHSQEGYVVQKLSGCALTNSSVLYVNAQNITGAYAYGDILLVSDLTGVRAYSDSDLAYLFTWSEIDIVGQNASFVGIDSEMNMLILNRDNGNIYTTKKAMKSLKTELTLAAVSVADWIEPRLASAIIEFNAASKDIRVNLKKYESVERLNIDIVAGNIPDLLDLSLVPFNSFANRGLFEDLTPFLDNSQSIALVPAFQKVLSTGNKLFRVSPGIYIYTLIGNPDYVGSKTGWTIGEVRQLLDNTKNGTTFINAEWGKGIATQYFLGQNLDKFADWESGTVKFESEDFKWTLELICSYPDEDHWVFDNTAVIKGTQLVGEARFYNLGGYAVLDRNFDKNWVIKGYPSQRERSGLAYAWPYSLAITSTCSRKEAAWEFICSTLLTDLGNNALSVTQSGFENQVYNAKHKPDSNMPPLLSEQLEQFLFLIENIEMVSDKDQMLVDIINEETAPYFAGQKTLDEVCAIIQNRAQTYVNEQR